MGTLRETDMSMRLEKVGGSSTDMVSSGDAMITAGVVYSSLDANLHAESGRECVHHRAASCRSKSRDSVRPAVKQRRT